MNWTWATGRSAYTRETNTMPQWAGSCWYELRYLDPTNERALRRHGERALLDGAAVDGDCGGVDLYVGGVEHAVLHLLYARFWHKVLYDLGYVSSSNRSAGCSTRDTSRRTRTPTTAAPSPAEQVVERDGRHCYGGAPVLASTARWASR